MAHAMIKNTFLILMWTAMQSVSAQTPKDDVLPLSVGNSWTYKCLATEIDYLGEWTRSDSGTTVYMVISSSVGRDSTLWGMREIRSLRSWMTAHFGQHNEDPYWYTDTATFTLIEYHAGNHRLVKTGSENWRSVFPMTADYADSSAYFRYYPSIATDTFSLSVSRPPDRPAYTFLSSFQKGRGFTATTFSDKVTGVSRRSRLTLLRSSVRVMAEDSLRREFYPLHKGDTWEYGETVNAMPQPQRTTYVVTVVDTLLPNGCRYAGISLLGAPGKFVKFVRIDSLLRVQTYDPALGDTCGGMKSEYTTYRLGERDSSIWDVYSSMDLAYFPKKILLRYNGMSPDSLLMFYSPGLAKPLSTDLRWNFQPFVLKRGEGVWKWNNGDGKEWYLTGSIINGKRSGSLVLSVSEGTGLPLRFSLEQNYPNPFNPSTEIRFTVPMKTKVTLTVFDVVGRTVASLVSEELNAGLHRRHWNASGMPSGVYFYRLQAGSFIETRRLIILK